VIGFWLGYQAGKKSGGTEGTELPPAQIDAEGKSASHD